MRAIHWLLLVAVVIAGWTGFFMVPAALAWHLAAGSAIVVLILLRIGIGLLGGGYAGFASFRPSARAALGHLAEIRDGRFHRHLGHNPLGALMVYALGAVLLALALTGAVALAGFFRQGPFRGFTGYEVGNLVYDLHQPLAWVLLGLIALHLGGVWFESRRAKENLVAAMIDGRKAALPPAPPPAGAGRPMLAGLAGLGASVMVALVVWRASVVPATGLPPAVLDAEVAEQCGSCHVAYNPVLAPAAVWRAIMGDLTHHFGQDASLGDPALHRHILDYLVANSAEHWDTQVAHRMLRRDARDPWRVTATPFWRREHRGIAPAVFARASVGGQGQCDACHSDAASGRFLPENIDIPE